MKIALATDHAGFELKETLKAFLAAEGHDVVDFGANEMNSDDDYPDFVRPAAEAVAKREVERAIVLGGSGQGEAMVANKVRGIRAAVFYGGNEDIITLSREHNDANILSLGARFLSEDEAKRVVGMWLGVAFSGDERHVRRIGKIDA